MKTGILKTLHLRLSRDKAVSDLAKGAGLALFLRCLGAGAAFALNVVIGRTLGLSEAGLYFTALSLASILAVVARLGIDNALLRLIAAEVAEDYWASARGYFVNGVTIVAGVGILLVLGVVLLAPLIAEDILGQKEMLGPIRFIAPSIAFFALMLVTAESLRGVGRIRDSVLVSGAIYPVFALLIIWPLARVLGADGAALAYSAGTGFAAAYGFWSWRRLTRAKAPAGPVDTARMTGIARKLWLATVINSALVPWLPVLVLGAVYGPAETAQLGAATRLAVIISFIFIAANTVLAPKFAQLEAKGQRDEMIRIARRFSLLTMLVSSPALVVMIFYPGLVMSLFGPGFSEGGTALTIVVLGQTINATFGLVLNLLLITGHERDIRNAALFSGAVLVAVTLVLLPPIGLLGAATANAAAVAAANLYGLWMVRKRLGFWIYPR